MSRPSLAAITSQQKQHQHATLDLDTETGPSVTCSTPFRFMDLPAELRVDIYNRLVPTKHKPVTDAHNLRLVSRQVKSEIDREFFDSTFKQVQDVISNLPSPEIAKRLALVRRPLLLLRDERNFDQVVRWWHIIQDRDRPCFEACFEDDWHHLIVKVDPMHANLTRKWFWDCDLDAFLRNLPTSVKKVTFNLDIPDWAKVNGAPTLSETETNTFLEHVTCIMEEKAKPYVEHGRTAVKGYTCVVVNWPDGVKGLHHWQVGLHKEWTDMNLRKGIMVKVVGESLGTPGVVCTIVKPKVNTELELSPVERLMMKMRRALGRKA